MRHVPLFAAVCVLCAWLYLAVRRGWRCCYVCFCACAVRRASLPHTTVLICGRIEGAEMCEGGRCFRIFASSTHTAPLGSLSQHPGRGSRGWEGRLQAQRGHRDAVHDGQPDPRVVPAHGARAQVRVRRCTHHWGGEAARHCGAVCVVWPGHAGGCEGRGGHGAVRLGGGRRRRGAAGAHHGLPVLGGPDDPEACAGGACAQVSVACL
ncbi:hypothetical protein ECC02_007783 [Trypanosoma cruzi]|uniref:Secreted protein n=1 Tax=Trypanosoma cruzi TaxID=5693 RepID=A0A7J6XZ41_TRYCR|nr:hypothetical protein ECC02_007783 [Trypanosoma cruzi]